MPDPKQTAPLDDEAWWSTPTEDLPEVELPPEAPAEEPPEESGFAERFVKKAAEYAPESVKKMLRSPEEREQELDFELRKRAWAQEEPNKRNLEEMKTGSDWPGVSEEKEEIRVDIATPSDRAPIKGGDVIERIRIAYHNDFNKKNERVPTPEEEADLEKRAVREFERLMQATTGRVVSSPSDLPVQETLQKFPPVARELAGMIAPPTRVPTGTSFTVDQLRQVNVPLSNVWRFGSSTPIAAGLVAEKKKREEKIGVQEAKARAPDATPEERTEAEKELRTVSRQGLDTLSAWAEAWADSRKYDYFAQVLPHVRLAAAGVKGAVVAYKSGDLERGKKAGKEFFFAPTATGTPEAMQELLTKNMDIISPDALEATGAYVVGDAAPDSLKKKAGFTPAMLMLFTEVDPLTVGLYGAGKVRKVALASMLTKKMRDVEKAAELAAKADSLDKARKIMRDADRGAGQVWDIAVAHRIHREARLTGYTGKVELAGDVGGHAERLSTVSEKEAERVAEALAEEVERAAKVAEARAGGEQTAARLRAAHEAWGRALREATEAQNDLRVVKLTLGEPNDVKIAEAAQRAENMKRTLDAERANLLGIMTDNEELLTTSLKANSKVGEIQDVVTKAAEAWTPVYDDLIAQAGLPERGKVITWSVGKQPYTGKVVGYRSRMGPKKQPVYVPVVEDAKGVRREASGWWNSEKAAGAPMTDAQLGTMDDLYKQEVKYLAEQKERAFRLTLATKNARKTAGPAAKILRQVEQGNERLRALGSKIVDDERLADVSHVAQRVAQEVRIRDAARADFFRAAKEADADLVKVGKAAGAYEAAHAKAARLAADVLFKERIPLIVKQETEHLRKSAVAAQKYLKDKVKAGYKVEGSLVGGYGEVVRPDIPAIDWLATARGELNGEGGVYSKALLESVARRMNRTPEEVAKIAELWKPVDPNGWAAYHLATDAPSFHKMDKASEGRLNEALDRLYDFADRADAKTLDLNMAQAIMDTWKDLNFKHGIRGTIASVLRMIDPVKSRIGDWSHNLKELYKSGQDEISAWNSEVMEVTFLIGKNAKGEKVDNPILLMEEYLSNAVGMPTRGGVSWFNCFNGEPIWLRFRRNILGSRERARVIDEQVNRYDDLVKQKDVWQKANRGLPPEELRRGLEDHDTLIRDAANKIDTMMRGDVENVPLMAVARMWLPSGETTPPVVSARLAGRAVSLLADDAITPAKFAQEMKSLTAHFMGGRVESSANRAWSFLTSGACLGATHDGLAARALRISGANLKPATVEALNDLMIGEYKALANVDDLNGVFEAAHAFGIPFTENTIRVTKEANGTLTRAMQVLQKNDWGEYAFMPRSVLREIDATAGRIVKELEPYHAKAINQPGLVALNSLQNFYNLWRTSVVTGLIVPNPGHWMNTAAGDFSQMWMEEGLLKATQLSFQNLPTNLPLGRLLHTYMSDMSAKYAGKPVLGSIINAMFNPHLGALFAGRNGAFVTRYGRTITFAEARKMMVEDNIPSSFVRGLMSDIWSRDPMYRGIEHLWGDLANKSSRFMQKTQWQWAGHMDALQARQRAALWLDYMQKGATRQEAKAAVMNALYDWTHAFSKTEAMFAARLTTFWRYFRLALDQSNRAIIKPLTQPTPDTLVKALTGGSRFGRARNQGLLVSHSLDTVGEPDADTDSWQQYVQMMARVRAGNQPTRPIFASIPSFGEPSVAARMYAWEDIKGRRQGYGYSHEHVSFPIMSVPDVYELYAVPYVAIAAVLPAALISAMGGPDHLNPGWQEALWEPVGDLMPQFVRVPIEAMLEMATGSNLSKVSKSGRMPLNAAQLAFVNTLPDGLVGSLDPQQDPETGAWTASTAALLALSNFPGVNQLQRYVDAAYFANPEIRQGNLVPGGYLGLRQLTGLGRVTPRSANLEAARNQMLINRAIREEGYSEQPGPGYQEYVRPPSGSSGSDESDW